MKTRPFGRTGLKLSALCLGGNSFGWTADEAASFAVLDAYFEAGGNYVDTCSSYSHWVAGNQGGESETIIGNWLRSRGNRHSMVIGTKAFNATGPGANQRGLSRINLMRAIDGSLSRLQTDYVDLYMCKYDDVSVSQEETMQACDDLVRQGKVRYVGAGAAAGQVHNLAEGMTRQYTAVRLMRALWVSDKHGWARHEGIEPEYNLLSRIIYEKDLEGVCEDQGLGVITRSSLGSGFLSGKYRRETFPTDSPRSAEIRAVYAGERGFTILDELDKVAARYNASVAQVALAWIMARPSVTAPIAGASSAAQVKELVGATELTIDPESMAMLNRVSAWTPGLETTRAAAGVTHQWRYGQR